MNWFKSKEFLKIAHAFSQPCNKTTYLRSKHHATKHHREPEGRTNRGEMKNTTLGGFATLVLKVHVFGGLDLDLEIQRIPSGLTDSQSPKMWRSC